MEKQTPPSEAKTRRVVVGFITLLALLLAAIILVGYLLFSNWENLKLYREYLNESNTNQRSDANKDLPEDLDYESVEVIYDYLRLNFDGQLDEIELLEGLKKGLLGATNDPHSVYLNPGEADYFEAELFNQLVGVGILLTLENNHPTVVTPLKGLPADKAGIKARDMIIKIDGQNTGGMSIHDAVSLITGAEDTEVTLTIHRQGVDEDLEFTLTRALINIPSVTYEIKEGIGIMSLTRFVPDSEEGEQTAELALAAAQTFKKSGVKGVILDLRSNPGGILDVVSDIGGLWLEPDQVVAKVGAYGKELETIGARSPDPAILSGIPLVILVNEASASAAEIIAGALKDHEVGIIVGKTTFGKTSVQNVEELDEGDILKVTIAHWYTPLGEETKEGIEPDIEIEDDPETEIDEQLEKALQILQSKV